MSVVAAVGPGAAAAAAGAYGHGQPLCGGGGARKRKDVGVVQDQEADPAVRGSDGRAAAAPRRGAGLFVLETVEEDADAERSSIGAPSEDEEEDGEEVDSGGTSTAAGRKGGALASMDMDALDDALPNPLRRASSTPCSSALASCLVATAFLLLSAGGAGAALFLLFRPRPPDISVAAVRLPSFSASNGTVAFTFEQTAAVRNPNRSPLAHFDSSLRVAYAGGDLGAVYIPAGLIDGGRTKHVSAVFDVPAIPVAQPTMVVAGAGAGADAASAAQQQSQPAAVIEVHSLLVVKGRVNVLRVLTHRVQAAKLCRVGVSPLDGTVLGFRC